MLRNYPRVLYPASGEAGTVGDAMRIASASTKPSSSEAVGLTKGLVRLGHVALDGTKVAANASVHKAMSYGRMQETEKRLAAEVSDWLTQAEARDAEEDRTHGGDRRGDEMPDWVANKAMLEAEAKQPPPDDEDEPGPSSGMTKSGKPQRGPDGGPPDRAQRNFTDPDSRIQPPRSKAVIAGYNAQIAVDGAHQIIVAQRLQTSPADARAVPGLLETVKVLTHSTIPVVVCR
jgi:hypothetical protein